MKVLREIGIIARALDSIANIEFRDLELARGQYLYLVRIGERELNDPSNQKIKKWILTEKGQALYPFILAEHAYSENTALKGFSKAEILQLEEWLAKMRENVAADWEQVKKGQKRNYSEVKK